MLLKHETKTTESGLAITYIAPEEETKGEFYELFLEQALIGESPDEIEVAIDGEQVIISSLTLSDTERDEIRKICETSREELLASSY